MHVVVVGAGAAGLVAAGFAARSGARVTVLERTRTGGKKIVASGGGRCNVLPSAFRAEQFVSASSSNTIKRILATWPLDEQRRFFEDEVGLHLVLEPETGKLFPASNRAQDVRDGLVDWAVREGATFRFDAHAVDVRPRDGGWTVTLASGQTVEADAVIVATGGLSVPATGSDGAGLRWAKSLGHAMVPTYAALTPLTATPAVHVALSGVSLVSTVTAGEGKKARVATGGFLVTHRGYSGPAVLDVSHRFVVDASTPVAVAWDGAPADVWDERLRAAGTVLAAVRRHLPQRLADALVAESGVAPGTSLAQLRKADRARLVALLAAYRLPVTGHEGYKKAEVTGGGVALSEVDPRTLESRSRPGLFFCGEVLDAFGPIGGYNFLWAWTTGRLAGLGSGKGV
ncbi:MAG: aminoacetone oxidase family FAD-binding enzyme [Rhodothermales bacterium]|nr:aminoacetone oxidase family FAD-binding enzyme [Rhodothermales bacterium]